MIIKKFFIISLLSVLSSTLHAVKSRQHVTESAVVGAIGTAGFVSGMALRVPNPVVRFAGAVGMLATAGATFTAATFYALTRDE